MRDLLFFALSCVLAAAFWISSQQRAQERKELIQAELYDLGAPQTMQDSPERWLLLGQFSKGLRSEPSPETYEKLAALYLVSTDLDGRKVVASAVLPDGMGRVIGKSLEFFNSQGYPQKPKVWLLGDTMTSWDKPLFQAADRATLVADGAWLSYQDRQRWVLFRYLDGELQGFVSTQEISVDDDSVLIKGKRRWQWGSKGLAPAAASPG